MTHYSRIIAEGLIDCEEVEYSVSQGFENSVDIINQGEGKHFDPELVKVFNNSLDEIRKIYEKNKPS